MSGLFPKRRRWLRTDIMFAAFVVAFMWGVVAFIVLMAAG